MKTLAGCGGLGRGELHSLKRAIFYLCDAGYAVSVSLRAIVGQGTACAILIPYPSGERMRAVNVLEHITNEILVNSVWLTTHNETLTCGIRTHIALSALREVLTELPVAQARRYLGAPMFGAFVDYYPSLQMELHAYDQIKRVLESTGFVTQEEELRALASINVDYARKTGPK